MNDYQHTHVGVGAIVVAIVTDLIRGSMVDKWGCGNNMRLTRCKAHALEVGVVVCHVGVFVESATFNMYCHPRWSSCDVQNAPIKPHTWSNTGSDNTPAQ
jgi:hypothetical protein